jgi:hypothetical protein
MSMLCLSSSHDAEVQKKSTFYMENVKSHYRISKSIVASAGCTEDCNISTYSAEIDSHTSQSRLLSTQSAYFHTLGSTVFISGIPYTVDSDHQFATPVYAMFNRGHRGLPRAVGDITEIIDVIFF